MIDPMAGIGKCFLLATEPGVPHPIEFTAVELEPDWADMDPRVRQGNVLHLDFVDGTFDGAFTSPVYGNRASDHHDARERCKTCLTMGHIQEADGTLTECPKCGGFGYRSYVRNTYRHRIGHELHPDNAGQLQWGSAYQDFHWRAWKEVSRVIRDLFILNVSDHVRQGKVKPVAAWHAEALQSLGWTMTFRKPVETPRNRYGANRELRVNCEWVLVFKRHLPGEVDRPFL
jgi:hypothetical protein